MVCAVGDFEFELQVGLTVSQFSLLSCEGLFVNLIFYAEVEKAVLFVDDFGELSLFAGDVVAAAGTPNEASGIGEFMRTIDKSALPSDGLDGFFFVMKVVDNAHWANEQFSTCQLSDQRRTQRLNVVANNMLANPEKSLPKQNNDWSDLKAAYRLFDRDEVSYEAISCPHCEGTRNTKPGTYLLISDTTDIDHFTHGATERLPSACLVMVSAADYNSTHASCLTVTINRSSDKPAECFTSESVCPKKRPENNGWNVFAKVACGERLSTK